MQIFNIKRNDFQDGREIKLVIVKTELLSDREYIAKLLKIIDPTFNNKNIIGIDGYNKASEKWYNQKYVEFRQYFQLKKSI